MPRHNCSAVVRASLGILAWWLVVFVQASHAQTSAPAPKAAELRLHLSVDLGRSQSSLPQVLPADWRSRFEPPSNPMTAEPSDHAWFVELGVALEPAFAIGSWQIGVPVSYGFVGLAPIGSYTRTYVYRKAVAGTTLDWWNPVLLHATALRKTSPAVGLSIKYRRLVIQPSVQAYKVLAQDFSGRDCRGCPNTSRLVSTREMAHGVGQRLDVFREGARDGTSDGGSGIGFFFERNGAGIWQLGARGRLTITLAARGKIPPS